MTLAAEDVQLPKKRNGSPESDRWRTTPALFEALNQEFNFTLDAAADDTNHLCVPWLGPGGLYPDALATPLRWLTIADGRAVYLNMPYSNPAPWLERCVYEVTSAEPGDDAIVTLHPYMPSERWWRFVERAVEVRRIPHRLKYLRPDGRAQTTARFPSAVSIFRPQPGIVGHPGPRYVTWDYRHKGAAT